jgi:hypothetical protein
MNEEYPPCPKCGGHHFKVWKWPAPVIVHWVLNPGLAFNELVLGQRIPKVQLICEDCDAPFYERSYVPCPHCHAMNRGRSWSKKQAFGNWLGYVCPSCGERIPCIWNFTSIVVLAITSPLWYLPYRFHFRDRVRAKPLPFGGEAEPIPAKRWFYGGAGWGLIMWLINSVAPALAQHSAGVGANWTRVWVGVPVWALGGLIFGFWMWRLSKRRGLRARGGAR